VDQIEVHVEQASGTDRPRRAKPSKTDRRVIAAVIVATVVALVVWLGSTTPNQAAPTSTSQVTTTTHPPPTTTSTPEFAAPVDTEPAEGGAVAVNFEEWAAGIAASEFVLEAPLRLFVRGASSQLIEISASGVNTQTLSCGGSQVNYIAGQLGDNLILQTTGSMCLAPTDNLEASRLIQDVPPDSGFTRVDDNSGWFCNWDAQPTQLMRYTVEEPIGETFDSIGCPLLARGDEVLLETQARGVTNVNGPVLFWSRPGDDLPGDPIVESVDCAFAGFAMPYLLCSTQNGLRTVNLLDGEAVDSIPMDLQSESQGAWGSVSPNGRYMILTRYDLGVDEIPDVGEQLPSVIVDLADGSLTELSWLRSDFPQFSWISETQLAVLQWDAPDCANCAAGIELVDLSDLSRTRLLTLPEGVRAFDVQMLS